MTREEFDARIDELDKNHNMISNKELEYKEFTFLDIPLEKVTAITFDGFGFVYFTYSPVSNSIFKCGIAFDIDQVDFCGAKCEHLLDNNYCSNFRMNLIRSEKNPTKCLRPFKCGRRADTPLYEETELRAKYYGEGSEYE